MASDEKPRLSHADCEVAIDLCKKARPIRDWPTVQVFPYLAKACGWCCWRKQLKVQAAKAAENSMKDALLTQLTSSFKGLHAARTDAISFKSKVQNRRAERAM